MQFIRRFHWITVCGAAIVLAVGLAAIAQETPEAPAEQVELATEPSPLLHEPNTPEAMFSAVLLMVDLGRLDLASRYLAQFVELNPDEELLIKLRDQHGTGEFLKLSRIPELKANAVGLLNQLSQASRKLAADPAYAQALIAKLGATPVQRELAVRQLRNLGEAAVPHLIGRLRQPDSDEQLDQIVVTLGRIGQPAVAPTIAALESPQTSVRLAVLAALRLLRSPLALPYLWHPAYAEGGPQEIQQAARKTLVSILSASDKSANRTSAEMAAGELRRVARGIYFHQIELPAEDDGTVVVWGWDDDAGTVVREALPPERANLFLATKFAKQLLDLTPENPESQRLYLGGLLGQTVAEAGRDQPISLAPETAGYTAMTAGEDVVTDLLADALAAGQIGTAQAALQILAQIGSGQMLTDGAGRKSPVLAALNYPDLRVQFAAANTVLRLEPNRSFRGAERVVSILQRAITNSEEAKALIVDADTSRAEVTSGYLADLGYAPVMTRTGKEGFRAAATTAGIELAIIHINSVRWDLSQTIANFRADARTAYLPIALYGPEDVIDVQTRTGRRDAVAFPEASSPIWDGTLPPGGRLDPIPRTTRQRLQRMILQNGPITFIAESGSASDFVDQIRPFLASVKGTQLTDEERAQYQSASVRWLAHLSQADKTSIFDLSSTESALSVMIEDPELASMTVVALSGIASNTVQHRLASVAGNSQLSPVIRIRAANQLAFHIQRHGVMLTNEQVREFDAVWKGESDPMVASALAAVMGSLHPEPKTVGERIGKSAAPR